MFTTTLFNRSIRNKSSSWRVLGYIPITSYYYSNIIAQKKFKGTQKSYRYNQLLDAVLESFIDAQQPGALDNVPLRLGSYEKVVNLKVPLFFIIGDIQGGDKVAGRFNSHSTYVTHSLGDVGVNEFHISSSDGTFVTKHPCGKEMY